MYHEKFTHDLWVREIKGIVYIEEWRPVVGFEAFYEVSSFGRFKSLRDDIIMRQYKNEKGYLTIGLNNETSRKKFKSHRLVGLAFIPNPENKPEINHDDFIKVNNFYLNLSWVTGKENADHAKKGGRRPTAKPPKEKVGEYPVRCQKIINSETGAIYESVYHLADELKSIPKELRRKLSGERPNNTPYRWLKGEFSIFYKKRYEKDLARYHELKPKIYGVAI